MIPLPRLTVAVSLCLLAVRPAAGQMPGQKRALVPVTDRVTCATGYALGNAIFIRTASSVVVVDTTESPSAAREILAAYRKLCPLPIRYIIYTHSHGDHINAAQVFKGEQTTIIAQKHFPEELARYRLLTDYNQRVNAAQFGYALAPTERGVAIANPLPRGYVAPDRFVEEEHKFEEGGVRFELYHAQGETRDHLMVWLPQEQVLLPGDLFYPSFPMLSSPMKHDRPIPEWIASLERMRKLRPRHLVPSHFGPLHGQEEIDTTLANYARAIRFVYDETVKGINKGLSLEEVRRQVQLPDDLARLPYLAPIYGRVEWAVNGIYRQLTGWYDFNPAHLNPGRRTAFHRALVEASGGADALVRRARQALEADDPQLALELVQVVHDAAPGHRGAHALSAAVLEKLAETTINGVERNIYRLAAREHRKAAEGGSRTDRP